MARTTEAQRAARRREVAKLVRLGKSYGEIADALDVSRSTIGRDVQRLREQWRKEASLDMDEHLSRRLAELKAIKREAFAAWLDSREGPRREKVRRKEGGGDPDEFVREITRKAGGDAKHLKNMLAAEKEIDQLLGVHDYRKDGEGDRIKALVNVIDRTAEEVDMRQFEDEEIR